VDRAGIACGVFAFRQTAPAANADAIARAGLPEILEVVAGLESNQINNELISIILFRSTQSLPHTLPHIFVNLTTVRFSILVKKLNE
jgi:hypothetical protein